MSSKDQVGKITWKTKGRGDREGYKHSFCTGSSSQEQSFILRKQRSEKKQQKKAGGSEQYCQLTFMGLSSHEYRVHLMFVLNYIKSTVNLHVKYVKTAIA